MSSAAALVQDARRRAHLSCRGLAERAGVTRRPSRASKTVRWIRRSRCCCEFWARPVRCSVRVASISRPRRRSRVWPTPRRSVRVQRLSTGPVFAVRRLALASPGADRSRDRDATGAHGNPDRRATRGNGREDRRRRRRFSAPVGGCGSGARRSMGASGNAAQ